MHATPNPPSQRPGIAVAAAIALATIAAPLAGSLATASAVREWYPTLNKPSWNPPAWLFGPVWTVLYIMMGVAAWVACVAASRRGVPRNTILTCYFVQLALNAAWSLIFFGAKAPGWALIEIVMLWGAIVATIIVFWKVSKLAGAMLIPYLLWVSFATVLNFTLWRMNP
jgi:translocator protein